MPLRTKTSDRAVMDGAVDRVVDRWTRDTTGSNRSPDAPTATVDPEYSLGGAPNQPLSKTP
eukprot:4278189-Prymnesium_polylepis.1